MGTRIKDYGSIEGYLRMVSAQGGFHFIVYDALTDRGVQCAIGEDKTADALRAFDRRVAVTGLIRYRSDGEPVSIEVDDLYVFPDDKELPTADDVYGIFSKVE